MRNSLLTKRTFLMAAGATAVMPKSIAAQWIQQHHYAPPVELKLTPKAIVEVISDMAQNLSEPLHTNLMLCMDASDSMMRQGLDEGWDASSNFARQAEGTAAALESDEVGQIIERKGGIGIACLQFASAARQSVGWAVVRNRRDAKKYAGHMREVRHRIVNGTTNIEAGLIECGVLFAGSPFEARNTVIDVSGDGSNDGGWTSVKDATFVLAKRFRARVNGLAICDKERDLAVDFKRHLVTDAEMFDACEAPMGRVWVVDDMRDYEQVMKQKLMDEIAAAPQLGRG